MDTAPRDALFFVLFIGFLGGLVGAVVTGALIRNEVQDLGRDFDWWWEIPVIGGPLGLALNVGVFWRRRVRRGRGLTLLALHVLSWTVVAVSAIVFELRG